MAALFGNENLEPEAARRVKDRKQEDLTCPFGSQYRGRSSGHRRRDAHGEGRGRKRRKDADDGGSESGVSSCSSASEVFRDASTSASKPSRERLVRFAEHHPGRLAARFLNRMRRKVMVEGEAATVQARAVPAAAKAYHLRVTQTSYPEASRRNLSEGSIIATVLDHLASKRYGAAADILAQRYTALEAVNGGIPWERARFLELVFEEDNTLVGQHERALVAHETAKAAKISSGASQQYGWKGGKGYDWSWTPKGAGKMTNPFADQEKKPAQQALVDGGVWQSEAGKGKNGQKGKKGKGKGKW